MSIEAGVESLTEEGRDWLGKKCRMTTGQLSDRLIQAACEEVYDQFAAELKDAP